MTEIERAIEYFVGLETALGNCGKEEDNEICGTALTALRAQAEREQGCKIVYHHRHLGEYKYITCPECNTGIEIEHPIEGDFPYCGGCGKVILDADQQFCGWCGRDLTKEKNT